MGFFLIALGAIVLIANLVTFKSRPRPANDSVNGMRRRKPGESDAAWESGLRIYLPFGVAVGVIGIIGGAVLLYLGPSWDLQVGSATFLVMIVTGIVGAVLLDRRVKRESRREAGLG